MINWKLICAIIAVSITADAAIAQTTPNYDVIARDADRALRAYKDLQDQKMADLAEESMAAAIIHLRICKPMHDQAELTRRQYIASVVKGRGKQKAVATECAEQELWYSSICKPRTDLDSNFKIVTSVEASCPAKWADWPPVPPIFSDEYHQRMAEIRQLYQ